MGRLRRFVMFVVVVVMVLLAVALPVMAQGLEQEAPVVPSLVEVLAMLAQGLGTGAILAFLFENFGWFQRLEGQAKWWFVFGVSIVLPLLAQVALQFAPAEVWAMLEPYWKALALGFLSWAGSQVAHMWQKRSSIEIEGEVLEVDFSKPR